MKASAVLAGSCVEAARWREGGQEAPQSDDTPCPIRLAEALCAKVGLEGKEFSPSDVHHCSPLARLHSKSEPSHPGPEPTSCPLHLAGWSWRGRGRRGSQPFQVHPRKCKTKQSGCLIENNKRNWKSTHYGKIRHLALPSSASLSPVPSTSTSPPGTALNFCGPGDSPAVSKAARAARRGSELCAGRLQVLPGPHHSW